MKTKKGKRNRKGIGVEERKKGKQEKKDETRKPTKGKLCLLSQLTWS